MKAKIEIRGDRGKYYARATGNNVTLREIEIIPTGSTETADLWRAVGPDNGRRIAIPREELSWLSDGNWHEYPYTLMAGD